MADNYRLIETAKERAVARDRDMTVLRVRDDVSKIEYPNGREVYEDGFRDYHGPRGDTINPD